MMHLLLDDAPRVRRRAVRALPASPALAYALRRVLFADRHADVRAAAARRLGRLEVASDARDVSAWLVEALDDGSPLVRDAILRALVRVGARDAAARVRPLIARDRIWWVRRTAVYALAALGDPQHELAVFEAALADPFWRVRHAAVKVLAALGARDLALRARLADDTPLHDYLRTSWGPALVEAPQRAAAPSQLPPALLDPDPAVVTARLADDRTTPPRAFVELLCDPHAPLRLLAAERVATSGDADAHRAALDWLEEPRIPHAADTVERILDGLGDDAVPLAALALDNTAPPLGSAASPGEARLVGGDRLGAARWAIGWIAATRYAPLVDAAQRKAERTPALRDAAIPLASIDQLVAWAAEPALRDAIAAELHARRAHDALRRLDTTAHPKARTLQLDAIARSGASIAHALGDPHYAPRAVAARWHRIGADDVDPAVREAAATHAALDDVDPWVARAAARRFSLDAPLEHIARALDAADPYIRAEACAWPVARDRGGDVLGDHPLGDQLFGRLLARVLDPDARVRSAALDALARIPAIDARVARLEARGPHPADVARVLRAWLHGEAQALPRAQRAARPRLEAAPRVAERRAFGRAGFTVAPLAISGAYDLSPAALALAADAGVDLLFWESGYHSLTRFLRTRPALRVITGSYHAEPAAIEADVDRALRKLRRDTLDSFLLFWTRSPARVDRAAFDVLDRLRRAGKIRTVGFSTHDRSLARAALEADPWDVVMTRHSAAHPGIESQLLPTARAHQTAILTFSALCYGRMTSGSDAPSDADCLRYSLAQPGVTAVVNAPRRRAEVAARVEVLASPTLTDDQLAALRAHGAGVRAESQRFNALVRMPTRDAAAAAREALAAELPPTDEIAARPLPRPSHARASRTQLGRARRRP